MKPFAALVIVFLGSGCSSAVTPSSPPPPSSPSSPSLSSPLSSSFEPSITPTSRSLLGTLRTRDREVLLYASPAGMKVTIKAPNGTLVADQVDLDTLRTLDPHIYDICRSGVAGRPSYLDATGRPSYLDATLDSRMRGAESRGEPAHPAPRWRP